MNIVKIFLFSLLFFPAVLLAEEAVNTPIDAIKDALPKCTPDYALYQELVKIGENPMWVAEENSASSDKENVSVIAFFLDEKSGNWSFVRTIYPSEKTCFALTGKKWQKMKTETPWTVVIGGDEKKVGYCAPFEQMSKELLGSGKMDVWFGFPDKGFVKNDITKATVYIFSAGMGAWTKILDTVDSKGAEIACIDAQNTERKEAGE